MFNIGRKECKHHPQTALQTRYHILQKTLTMDHECGCGKLLRHQHRFSAHVLKKSDKTHRFSVQIYKNGHCHDLTD